MLVTKENAADINEQWHVVRMSHIPGRGASTPHSIRPGTHGEYSTHKKSLHQIIHSQSLITNNPFCKMYQSIKPFLIISKVSTTAGINDNSYCRLYQLWTDFRIPAWLVWSFANVSARLCTWVSVRVRKKGNLCPEAGQIILVKSSARLQTIHSDIWEHFLRPQPGEEPCFAHTQGSPVDFAFFAYSYCSLNPLPSLLHNHTLQHESILNTTMTGRHTPSASQIQL